MARSSDVTGETRSLFNVEIPYPNPYLAEFLTSPAARNLVERYTAEVFAIYEANLPIRRTRLGRVPPPGNLKRSAYYRVDRGGFGGKHDRWVGHVGNFAPYSRVIEYGSRQRGIAGRHTLLAAFNEVFGHASASGAFTNLREEHAKVLDRKDRNSEAAQRKMRVKAKLDASLAHRASETERKKNNARISKLIRARNKEFHQSRRQLEIAERGAARIRAKHEARLKRLNETTEERRARLGIVSAEDIAKDEKRLRRKTRSDKGKARGTYQPRDPDRKNKTARLPEKKRGKEGNRAAKRFNELVEVREKRLAAYAEGPRARYNELLAKEEAADKGQGPPLTSREERFMEHYLENLHDD